MATSRPLAAATRNLGERVEIRIRDNGTGIPLEVKEKMFNPFFTTKPAGEGTGLGLSIGHDIIVKQHGGSIEVETQPGEFTEIRVILPRASCLTSLNRSQSIPMSAIGTKRTFRYLHCTCPLLGLKRTSPGGPLLRRSNPAIFLILADRIPWSRANIPCSVKIIPCIFE